MTDLKSVPWLSTAEWASVKQELFSGIPSQQRHAFTRIDAWRCRSPRSLPVSIISTVDLMRLALLDETMNNESNELMDETQLRLAYSMALVRFVNLATEILQKRTAQAVHMLAGDLGLPEWLVNIRHEATHYTLPSLDLLRNGTSVALEWLKLTYWDEQSKDIHVSDSHGCFGVECPELGHDDLSIALKDNELSREEKLSTLSRMTGNWSKVPLGILPGQTLTYHSLELPTFLDELNCRTVEGDIPTLSYCWQDDVS